MNEPTVADKKREIDEKKFEREYAEIKKRLDDTYFYLDLMGDVGVGRVDPDKGLVVYAPDDFKRRERETVWVAKGAKVEQRKAAALWLDDPKTTLYEGVGLWDVGKEPSGHLNLFSGFALDSADGDPQQICLFFLEVICGNDTRQYTAMMNLLAYWVQNPCTVGLCALALTGLKGRGKTTVFKILRRIFGAKHSIHASSSHHIAGHFNAHLARALLVFADEALFHGDKRERGNLNRIITEPTLMIEPKRVNAFEVPNCSKLIIASNDPQPMEATEDERRYLSLEAGFEADPVIEKMGHEPLTCQALLDEEEECLGEWEREQAYNKKWSAYFDRLYTAIPTEAPMLLRVLLERKTSEEMVRRPLKTRTLKTQVALGIQENPFIEVYREHVALEREKPATTTGGRRVDNIKLTNEVAWRLIGAESPERRVSLARLRKQALLSAGFTYKKMRDGDRLTYGWVCPRGT